MITVEKKSLREVNREASVGNKLKAALMLDRASTHYQVEYTPGEAWSFVVRAEAYNNFTSDILSELVERINALIPPMQYGTDNPNNGKPHHRFQIGNEGSRVLYVEILKTYLKGRWGDVEYERLATALATLGYGANANEASRVDGNSPARFRFRFWWD